MSARGPRAVVVVPARDEEARLAGCLRALAGQTVARDRFAVVVVLDACRDATAEVLGRCVATLPLEIGALPGLGAGPGWARRVGMEHACTRLLAVGRPDGLIACTDADSQPAPDWLERQLTHVARGAEAIAGLVELDPAEAATLPAGVLARRRREATTRLRRVREHDPTAAHHHCAGASLAVTASAYRRVGGIEPLAELEDAAFGRRLQHHGVRLLRPTDVRVRTSARLTGRVGRGLAADLARFVAEAGGEQPEATRRVT